MPNLKRLTIAVLISFLVAIVVACILTILVAYIRPEIHEWDVITGKVDFPDGAPGDTVYSKSNITLSYYDYDVFVNLKIRSTDLVGPSSFTIGASNLSASCDNRTFLSLENEYKTVCRLSRPNIHEIRLYWKLDIPVPCPAGKYNFTYSVQAIDARKGDINDQILFCLRVIEYEISLFLSSLFFCFSLCFLLFRLYFRPHSHLRVLYGDSMLTIDNMGETPVEWADITVRVEHTESLIRGFRTIGSLNIRKPDPYTGGNNFWVVITNITPKKDWGAIEIDIDGPPGIQVEVKSSCQSEIGGKQTVGPAPTHGTWGEEESYKEWLEEHGE